MAVGRPWLSIGVVHFVLATSLLMVAGCDDGTRLWVELRSDVRPELEFIAVRAEVTRCNDPLNPLSNAVFQASQSQDFMAGQLVADLRGLPAETLKVTLTLESTSGEVVSRTSQLVNHAERTRILASIARDCMDMECPGEADDADQVGCFAGQCVVDPCNTEASPWRHPMDECTVDAECPEAAGCSTPRCTLGACLYAADDSACQDGAWCNPEQGCTSDSMPISSCPGYRDDVTPSQRTQITFYGLGFSETRYFDAYRYQNQPQAFIADEDGLSHANDLSGIPIFFSTQPISTVGGDVAALAVSDTHGLVSWESGGGLTQYGLGSNPSGASEVAVNVGVLHTRPGLALAGSWTGRIYRSIPPNEWIEVTNQGPSSYVTSITTSALDPQQVFVGLSRPEWLTSSNGGESLDVSPADLDGDDGFYVGAATSWRVDEDTEHLLLVGVNPETDRCEQIYTCEFPCTDPAKLSDAHMLAAAPVSLGNSPRCLLAARGSTILVGGRDEIWVSVDSGVSFALADNLLQCGEHSLWNIDFEAPWFYLATSFGLRVLDEEALSNLAE